MLPELGLDDDVKRNGILLWEDFWMGISWRLSTRLSPWQDVYWMYRGFGTTMCKNKRCFFLWVRAAYIQDYRLIGKLFSLSPNISLVLTVKLHISPFRRIGRGHVRRSIFLIHVEISVRSHWGATRRRETTNKCATSSSNVSQRHTWWILTPAPDLPATKKPWLEKPRGRAKGKVCTTVASEAFSFESTMLAVGLGSRSRLRCV